MIDETIYKATDLAKRKANVKIPFDKMEVGQSVFLHFSEVQEKSLRSNISTQNSKGEKKFKVLKHTNKEYFEVTCIPNVEAEVVEQVYKIVEPSEDAKKLTNTGLRKNTKYPFNDLPEGKSFIIPIKGTNENSLNIQCYTQGAKLGKKFFLLKHEQYGMFEVYCAPKVNLQFFELSAEMQKKASGGE